jgi:predicted metal-dependent peptidase
VDHHRLAAARLQAATRFPYLAAVLFASPVVAAPGLGRLTVDTAWRLHVDPAVAEAMPVGDLAGVMVHLSGHLLRDHAARAGAAGVGGDELHRWVDAADAEIDDDLPADVARPPGAASPDDLACGAGRLAEEYYRRGTPRTGSTCDCGSGSHGVARPWEDRDRDADRHDGDPDQDDRDDRDDRDRGLTPEQQEMVRQKVAADVLSHDPGTVGRGLRRWAEQRRTPAPDWRRVLAAELRRATAVTTGAVDYTYGRPSRRAAVSPQVLLPALRRPVANIAVVCDTSASVSEHLLGEALSAVDGIAAAVGAPELRVLSCDDRVHAVSRVRRATEVQLFGGGGTDMAVGIDAALDHRPEPDVVVVLTDGFTPWPPARPPRVTVVAGLLCGDTDPPPPPAWVTPVAIRA